MESKRCRAVCVELGNVDLDESACARKGSHRPWLELLSGLGLRLINKNPATVAEIVRLVAADPPEVLFVISDEALSAADEVTRKLKSLCTKIKSAIAANLTCVLLAIDNTAELAMELSSWVPVTVGCQGTLAADEVCLYASAFHDRLARGQPPLAAHEAAKQALAYANAQAAQCMQAYAKPTPALRRPARGWVYRSLLQREAVRSFVQGVWNGSSDADRVAILQAPRRFGGRTFLRQMYEEAAPTASASGERPLLRYVNWQLGASVPRQPDGTDPWFQVQGQSLRRSFDPRAASVSGAEPPIQDAPALVTLVQELARPHWELHGQAMLLVIDTGDVRQNRSRVWRLFESLHTGLMNVPHAACGLRAIIVSHYPKQAIDTENFENKSSIRLVDRFVLDRLPPLRQQGEATAELGGDVTFQIASQFWTRATPLCRTWLNELWNVFAGHPDLLCCAVEELSMRTDLDEEQYLALLRKRPSALKELYALVGRRSTLMAQDEVCRSMFRRLQDEGSIALHDLSPTPERAMALCSLYANGLLGSDSDGTDFQSHPTIFWPPAPWLVTELNLLLKEHWS